MTDEDKAMHKGLMKLLNEGTYALKAREVPAFLKVYEWAQKLEEKLKPFPIKKVNKKNG